MLLSILLFFFFVVLNAAHATVSITYSDSGRVLIRGISDPTPIPVFNVLANITVCLAVAPAFPHFTNTQTSACDIVTNDCRCYVWQTTSSNKRCVVIVPSATPTTTRITWRLSQRKSQAASPPRAFIFYSFFHTTYWPSLSWTAFRKMYCDAPPPGTHSPPPATVVYTATTMIVPRAYPFRLADQSFPSTIAIPIAATVIFIIHVAQSHYLHVHAKLA
jgi:hypothetical protein